MFLLWIHISIIAIFKSYPVIGDFCLQIAFIPLIIKELKGLINFLILLIF